MSKPATVALLSALVLGGCAAAGSQAPELMARCTQLYLLWARYGPHLTFHHSGQRTQAELALHDCENGHFDRGLAELERLLRRERIPVPPE